LGLNIKKIKWKIRLSLVPLQHQHLKKRKIVPKVLSFPSYQIVQKETHNLRVESSFSKDERQHAII